MNKEYLDELCGLLLQAKNRQDILLLLQDLITPQELESISERLAIFKLLLKKVPHRKISEELGVSISKVTRGSHALKISKSAISK
ncbi:MAG: Trp family transcriptional regulator [Candidatus Gracilibacteria bacterium]|jgi:TrpR family trp operon transcriptional repressor